MTALKHKSFFLLFGSYVLWTVYSGDSQNDISFTYSCALSLTLLCQEMCVHRSRERGLEPSSDTGGTIYRYVCSLTGFQKEMESSKQLWASSCVLVVSNWHCICVYSMFVCMESVCGSRCKRFSLLNRFSCAIVHLRIQQHYSITLYFLYDVKSEKISNMFDGQTFFDLPIDEWVELRAATAPIEQTGFFGCRNCTIQHPWDGDRRCYKLDEF